MDTFQKEIKKIQKKDWQLWSLVIFLFLIFTSFIVLVIFYSDIQEMYAEQIDAFMFNFLLVGFVALSLLFLGYVVIKEISIKKLQRDLVEQSIASQTELRKALRDLKQTQAQLIQAEKMAGIGQLAAGVAHELNNPLGGILGYCQFALEKITKKPLKELTGEDISTYSQYLKDIEQQSKRCKAIIQSLLKFSRASVKEDFEPIDVNSVLKETFTFVNHQLEKHKVKLEEVLSPSLPRISGNTSQLQHVFTNLILNAIQAMLDGGKLRVLTKISEDKKSLEISFADTGKGISKENLSKIFEPFFTTRKAEQRIGLGLSVSYGITKDLGGNIEVESTVGQGTTFTVILPLRREAEINESKDKRAYPEEVGVASS